MTGWMQHFIIAPIVLPMAVSAVMLAFNEQRRALKRVLSLTTMAGLVVIAALLLWQADGRLAIGDTGPAGAYLLGNWPAPSE